MNKQCLWITTGNWEHLQH